MQRRHQQQGEDGGKQRPHEQGVQTLPTLAALKTSRPFLRQSHDLSRFPKHDSLIAMAYPNIDAKAPDFVAPVVGGDFAPGSSLKLSSLRGQWVLLYFYPKDDTPGCTTQACGLRDEFKALGKTLRVFGISPDSVGSHEKFIRKFELPFPLISDADQAIANAYGVWVEKSMYGRKYMGVERSSMIIDPEGKLRAVLPKVKPAEHVAQVQATLKELGA